MTARAVALLLWLAAWAAGEDSESDDYVVGELADISEFPFLTSLQKRNFGHRCIANLVTYSWLLTAAHCVNSQFAGPPSDYFIVAGVTNLSRDADDEEGQHGKPDLFVLHPLVRVGGSYDYDLAMIRLESPLSESRGVNTVALPLDMVPPQVLYSDRCVVAGWGNTQALESRREERVLRKVELPLVDTDECSEKLLRALRDHVHLCTFSEDRDACQGDSGAALLCQGVQVGVVSWGMGCASDYPGVYARVDTQMAWLQQVIAAAPHLLPSGALCAACSLAVVGLSSP